MSDSSSPLHSAKMAPILKVLGDRFPEYDKDRLTAFIVCKNVLVDGQLCTDPKAKISPGVPIRFTFDKFVSRGGLKLEHALAQWRIDVSGLVMLDAGSSTGGFTDCLLQRGAKLVHSVDVGFNQLDWKLRTDARVIVHEKQNIMTLEALDPTPQAAVCDLSFRSIKGAASHILSLCGGTWLISLIKPQFEVPRWQENFFGVVEDPDLLERTMRNVHQALEEDGVGIKKLIRSPITGRKGNMEYLALLMLGPGMDEAEFMDTLQ
ncbi:MAG: TlyA family RNA methyltransferase [Sphaerochaetaceae bacterium]|jgi:23S rRNA (cytidine1920-2'-O)/16S rRNA (cytidine1409-2'-O)-methyltransferase